MDSVDANAEKEPSENQSIQHKKPFRRCKQKMTKIILRNYSLQINERIIYL
jgi:hypothetical protein